MGQSYTRPSGHHPGQDRSRSTKYDNEHRSRHQTHTRNPARYGLDQGRSDYDYRRTRGKGKEGGSLHLHAGQSQKKTAGEHTTTRRRKSRHRSPRRTEQPRTEKQHYHDDKSRDKRHTKRSDPERKSHVRATHAPSRPRRPPEQNLKPAPEAKDKTISISELGLPPAKERKECTACIESRSSRHFPQRPPTQQCDHEVHTCRRCLRAWIKSQLDSRIWDQIGCPDCASIMQCADVREFAGVDEFRRWVKTSVHAS
jgi:hypothetical protein